jgi:hemerythrin superfamily protein
MSLKSAVRNATQAVAGAMSLGEQSEARQDILKTLKDEHNEVKELLSELAKCTAAGQRKGLVKRIRKALVPHTRAEEKIVYEAVLALRDTGAKVDGYEGYLEHEWASKTLQRLGSIANAASPEHRAAGKVLKELVEHHIREEETNIWGDVKAHFTDEQRGAMNRRYLAAKNRVRVT